MADPTPNTGAVPCSFVIGRACGVRMKDGTRGAVPFHCPNAAVSVYVRASDGKRVGRCAEHDQVVLGHALNAGWSKER